MRVCVWVGGGEGGGWDMQWNHIPPIVQASLVTVVCEKPDWKMGKNKTLPVHTHINTYTKTEERERDKRESFRSPLAYLLLTSLPTYRDRRYRMCRSILKPFRAGKLGVCKAPFRDRSTATGALLMYRSVEVILRRSVGGDGNFARQPLFQRSSQVCRNTRPLLVSRDWGALWL